MTLPESEWTLEAFLALITRKIATGLSPPHTTIQLTDVWIPWIYCTKCNSKIFNHCRLFTTSLFYGIDTFLGPYFHFFLELALETWAKASLTHSLWVHDPNHIHSLASFQWSGLSDQWTLHLTKNCLHIWLKWYPYKGRGVVSAPFVLTRWKWSSQCRPVLQPAKADAMCMACV